MSTDPELVRAVAEAMQNTFPNPEQDQDEPTYWMEAAEAALAAVQPMIALRTMKQYADGLEAWEERIRADQDRKTRERCDADIKAAIPTRGDWMDHYERSEGLEQAAQIVRAGR